MVQKSGVHQLRLVVFPSIHMVLPSRKLTYPTWGKGKSSSNMPYQGDMLIPWRVYIPCGAEFLPSTVWLSKNNLLTTIFLDAVRGTTNNCFSRTYRRTCSSPWPGVHGHMNANAPYVWTPWVFNKSYDASVIPISRALARGSLQGSQGQLKS